MIRSLTVLLAVCLTVSLLSGCKSAPPKPAVARTTVSAAVDVNPNSQGRPSPVHVRIFQLKESGPFMAADFFALYDKEPETLGTSLVQRMESDLTPGEQQQIEIKIDPATQVLGVMAEFADYRNSQWRAITAPIKKKLLVDVIRKKKKVFIRIDKDRTSITLGE